MEAHSALLKWIAADETAAEFFSRQRREAIATGLPFVDAHVKLRPGNILELAGPAGAAKSELLIQIAVHLLLSSTAQEAAEQEHVVVLDCDGKFDVLRLLQVLTARLAVPIDPASLQPFLQKFHLVRCFNSLELLLALNSLPQQLAALQGRCRLLLIDNIAAHVWTDRAAVFGSQHQQLPSASAPGSSWQTHPQLQPQQLLANQLPMHTHPQQQYPGSRPGPTAEQADRSQGPGLDALGVQTATAALLQALSQQWRMPVIMTKQTAVHLTDKPGGPSKLVQREVLTAPLQNAVGQRLVLLPAHGQHLVMEGQGKRGAVVMLQWQTDDFTGPIRRCLIQQAGLQMVEGEGITGDHRC